LSAKFLVPKRNPVDTYALESVERLATKFLVLKRSRLPSQTVNILKSILVIRYPSATELVILYWSVGIHVLESGKNIVIGNSYPVAVKEIINHAILDAPSVLYANILAPIVVPAGATKIHVTTNVRIDVAIQTVLKSVERSAILV
jgi:hypothetical protein